MIKMRVTLSIIFFCQLSLSLPAATFASFMPTGSSVKIFVQGNDKDAIKLFKSLKMEAVEDNGKLIKHLRVESTNLKQIFEVICRRSKVSPNAASCTITVDKSYSWNQINIKEASVTVAPYGDMDNYASYSEFTEPDSKDLIFLSSDSALQISVERDSLGDIFRFRMEYKPNN